MPSMGPSRALAVLRRLHTPSRRPRSPWRLHLFNPTWNRSSRSSSSHARGLALERRVAALLRQSGYTNVQMRKLLRDAYGNLSEVDLVCGFWRRLYVECKNYSDRPVPLEEVAKFKEVLALNRIAPSRGLFITTSTFAPRCSTIGIRTVDGTQLIAWERRVRRRRACHLIALAVIALTVFLFLALPLINRDLALKALATFRTHCLSGALTHWKTVTDYIHRLRKKWDM